MTAAAVSGTVTAEMTTRRPTDNVLRRLVALLAAAALVVTACGGSTSIDGDGDTAAPVDTAPATSTPANESEIPPVSGTTAIEGSLIEFNDLLGQDTVLWFWAPW